MKERYRLLGSNCENCGSSYFPQTEVCPKCRRKGRLTPIEFSGKGTIYSYSILHSGSPFFENSTPYVLALVQLEEGPKVMSHIVDCDHDKVRIGMEVEVCFRKLFELEKSGIISYGFKFRPIDKSWMKYYNQEKTPT